MRTSMLPSSSSSPSPGTELMVAAAAAAPFRSHTETFNLLRNNARKQKIVFKQFVQASKEEERVHLVTANGYANVADDDNDGEDEDDEIMTGMDSSVPSEPPRWMAMVDEFRQQLHSVQKRLSELEDLQDVHLRAKVNCIFDEGTENDRSGDLERQVERLTREISVSVTSLQQKMLMMRTLSSERPHSRVMANVVRWECREVMDLSAAMREAQKNYLNRLNENERGGKEFVISLEDFIHAPPATATQRQSLNEPSTSGTGPGGRSRISNAAAAAALFEDPITPDLISDVISTADPANALLIDTYDPLTNGDRDDPSRSSSSQAVAAINGQITTTGETTGWDHEEEVLFDVTNPSTPLPTPAEAQLQTQKEIIFLETDMDLVRERDRDVSLVVKSLYELNSIFRDLSTLVVTQGSVLDRIDFNLENVQVDVERGAEQIRKAERSVVRARRVKRFIFGLIFTFLFILFIVFFYS